MGGFFGLSPYQIAIALQSENSSFRDKRTQVLRAMDQGTWEPPSAGEGSAPQAALPSPQEPAPLEGGGSSQQAAELAGHLAKTLLLVPNI